MAQETRKYQIYHHTDDTLEVYDDDRCCAWSDVPRVAVTGTNLQDVINQCRGAMLCAIGLYPNPPQSIEFEETKRTSLADRPKFDSR